LLVIADDELGCTYLLGEFLGVTHTEGLFFVLTYRFLYHASPLGGASSRVGPSIIIVAEDRSVISPGGYALKKSQIYIVGLDRLPATAECGEHWSCWSTTPGGQN